MSVCVCVCVCVSMFMYVCVCFITFDPVVNYSVDFLFFRKKKKQKITEWGFLQCVSMCVYVYLCVCEYMYVRAHTHTHTHTIMDRRTW